MPVMTFSGSGGMACRGDSLAFCCLGFALDCASLSASRPGFCGARAMSMTELCVAVVAGGMLGLSVVLIREALRE